ncbi:MAG TPA: PspC domain-containing protein [Mycobacteriales bacterium]|nr:PspC domain-containing protein [Mycobacteriales bacterium]
MTTADMPSGVPRRLTRSREGRIIAGVCQGAAQHFDIDPVIFRIVLAVLTVFGGAGVVIYALCWLLIPDEGSPQTGLERWLHSGHDDLRRIILLAVIAICVVIFLSNTNIFAHRVGAAAVAVVAVLLITDVVGRRRGHGLFTARRTSTPLYYGPPNAPAAAPVGPPAATIPLPQPVAPRERAWLGWLTFGAVLVAAGVMSLVASSGAAHPQPADVFATCVAVAGAGLLVGGFLGRARAMIPIGVLLVFGLVVTNALPRDLTWSAGTRDWTPVASNLAPSYVLGAGKADLDLSRLPVSTTATIDVRIGAGRLHVFVPPGMGVVVDAKLGAGRLHIFSRDEDGTGVKVREVVAASRPHAGTLTLDLQGGFGDLEVLDAAA